MRTSSARLLIAAATSLAVALGPSVLPAKGALAAVAGARPAGAPAHAPKPGIYVDHTRVPGRLAYAFSVTRAGYRHWAGPSGRRFSTLAPGATKARRTRVRFDDYYGVKKPAVLDTVASVNGKRVDVVTWQPTSVQVVQVSQRARRLPEITAADEAVVTTSPDPGVGYPIGGIVALAHNRVAILFANDPAVATNNGAPVVYIGKPGHIFRRATLPGIDGACDYQASGLARDPHNGELYVVCVGYDENSFRNQFQVWSARTSHDPFTGPEVFALDHHYENVTGFAVTHGRLWATLSGATVGSRGDHLVHRSKGGGWSQMEVPRATFRDVQPTLAVDPRPSSHAVWEANLRNKTHHRGTLTSSGIEVRRLGKRISPPRLATRGNDQILGFAVAWDGSRSLLHEVLDRG
ncbi:MAG: hypothetical protein JO214_08320 [Frankiaceae bacterium]|nr:hypothetical protein [Frankiaceae bacterium]